MVRVSDRKVILFDWILLTYTEEKTKIPESAQSHVIDSAPSPLPLQLTRCFGDLLCSFNTNGFVGLVCESCGSILNPELAKLWLRLSSTNTHARLKSQEDEQEFTTGEGSFNINVQ